MSKPEDNRLRVSGKHFRQGSGKVALKGVTYGPFEKRPDGLGLPPVAQARADLERIAALGANVIRLYEPPDALFLDDCHDRKLRVFISIPWTDHVDFLHERGHRDAAVRAVRETVAKFRGHPAVGGYFVGNEIQATLVRWLGARKVVLFLEALIAEGRKADPEALFAYANYPSTEYLNPRNADFLAFNIYLENQDDYARYLARLQNLAGDRPLVVAEFGCDSKAHGEAMQAEMLDWQMRETLIGGGAGSIHFAFTDAWYRGGAWVRGWDFGLVRRDRSPKLAYETLSRRLPSIWQPADAIRLPRLPKISVIVCTYNGEKTLRACLQSLKRLNYHDYEILVVDDGSNDHTPQIAREFTGVRYCRQAHQGLGAARNRGARESTGEFLAYTDDDCEADEDWLLFLAHAFLVAGFDAAGGPNIPPPATGLVQACVAAAPGSPTHVLLGDRSAEHLPGCNLAVTRAAFDRVGGFGDEFRAAGDDVDFCWRLLAEGFEIGFVPGAFVWHHRRASAGAYLWQQIGYGRAEALLVGPHADRFGRLGGARWRGVVYQSNQPHTVERLPRIYQGVFGYAPFQTIYAEPLPELFNLTTSFPWMAAVVVLGGLGLVLSGAWILAALMLSGTLAFTLRDAHRRRVEPAYAGLGARLVLGFLCTAQPVLRGAARFLGSLRRGARPRGPLFGGKVANMPRFGFWKRVGHLALWSTRGFGRDILLERTVLALHPLGWPFLIDNGWRDWDLEVRQSRWWKVRMTSVTEFHGGKDCLTRVRFSSKASFANIAANGAVAAAFVTLLVLLPAPLHRLWTIGAYFLWWVFLEVRHRQLVEAFGRIVANIAYDIGFDRVTSDDIVAVRRKSREAPCQPDER